MANVMNSGSMTSVGKVPMSTFAYVFGELVQYSQSRVNNTGDLERRLEEVGRCMGSTLVELLLVQSNSSTSSAAAAVAEFGSSSSFGFAPLSVTRHTRVLDILRYIYTTVWRYMFGRQAKDLQQSNDHSDEYMISDDEENMWIGRFVSVPKDMGNLNCFAFVAGVVQGVLEGAGFPTIRVTAHFVPQTSSDNKESGGQVPSSSSSGGGQRVTLLIKFDPRVLEREAMLAQSD